MIITKVFTCNGTNSQLQFYVINYDTPSNIRKKKQFNLPCRRESGSVSSTSGVGGVATGRAATRNWRRYNSRRHYYNNNNNNNNNDVVIVSSSSSSNSGRRGLRDAAQVGSVASSWTPRQASSTRGGNGAVVGSAGERVIGSGGAGFPTSSRQRPRDASKEGGGGEGGRAGVRRRLPVLSRRRRPIRAEPSRRTNRNDERNYTEKKSRPRRRGNRTSLK